MKSSVRVAIAAVFLCSTILAQGERPASPPGAAAAEVGGKYVSGAEGPEYRGGKWIEITSGRPLRRGREPFSGVSANYGKIANPDAPVWRAGANVTTQLKTEVPLVISNKTIAPGTYTMFIDLKPNTWTLIISNWEAQTRYDPSNKKQLWGAYRVHARQGCRACPYDCCHVAVFDGTDDVGVHGYDRGRWKDYVDLGQDGCVDVVQSGTMTE